MTDEDIFFELAEAFNWADAGMYPNASDAAEIEEVHG